MSLDIFNLTVVAAVTTPLLQFHAGGGLIQIVADDQDSSWRDL